MRSLYIKKKFMVQDHSLHLSVYLFINTPSRHRALRLVIWRISPYNVQFHTRMCIIGIYLLACVNNNYFIVLAPDQSIPEIHTPRYISHTRGCGNFCVVVSSTYIFLYPLLYSKPLSSTWALPLYLCTPREIHSYGRRGEYIDFRFLSYSCTHVCAYWKLPILIRIFRYTYYIIHSQLIYLSLYLEMREMRLKNGFNIRVYLFMRAAHFV